jgi:hypothetical protein
VLLLLLLLNLLHPMHVLLLLLQRLPLLMMIWIADAPDAACKYIISKCNPCVLIITATHHKPVGS